MSVSYTISDGKRKITLNQGGKTRLLKALQEVRDLQAAAGDPESLAAVKALETCVGAWEKPREFGGEPDGTGKAEPNAMPPVPEVTF